MIKLGAALTLVLALSWVLSAWPDGPKRGAKKNQLNTNLYEKEDSSSSFSGKVKAVREVQGEIEVFIDNPQGRGGPFVLPQNIGDRARLLQILNDSQKTGGNAVTISIDDQDRIKSVVESQRSNNSQKNLEF